MSRSLEVWLDCDLCPLQRLGTLAHDRGQVRFHYDKTWLTQQDIAFAIDPQLTLDAGPFFPKPEAGNFGVFLDSSPDRWGQTLMRRRETLQAKDEKRTARTLYSWDFLLGVQDITRQGALRFRFTDSDTFLANEALAAPPITSLAELAAIAKELTRKHIDNLDQLRRWLAVLVAPGASLGGARPKANFCDKTGALWIAKFPAAEDDRDIGAWEGVTWWLARQAGIDMPVAKVERLGQGGHHTFCVQRFDRTTVNNEKPGRRRFYASAMTLLGKDVSEGTSYLELAEFLARRGDPDHIQVDLEQLFRRVVFNIVVGNREDHQRHRQHPADVPDHGLGLHGPERDDLGDLAVLLADVVDHLRPVHLADVDIDIGHLVSRRVHESLEQQVVLDRVEVGDPQRVGHVATTRRQLARHQQRYACHHGRGGGGEDHRVPHEPG